MPPKALSISQVTECGTVYAPRRDRRPRGGVPAARAFAPHGRRAFRQRPRRPRLHPGRDDLEGRASTSCPSAPPRTAASWREAVVVFDPALAESLAYRRKRAGQTISKGRLIAAQFEGYFADDHWLDNARHANALATRLSEGLASAAGRAPRLADRGQRGVPDPAARPRRGAPRGRRRLSPVDRSQPRGRRDRRPPTSGSSASSCRSPRRRTRLRRSSTLARRSLRREAAE